MRTRSRWLLAAVLLLAPLSCARSADVTRAAAVEIEGLPGYPGATELEHESRGAHWGYHHGSVGRLMVTDAPFDEVKAFYERVIAEQGWTVIVATEKEGTIHWHLYQGSSLGDIEIAPRPGGKVEIHLDRHDH